MRVKRLENKQAVGYKQPETMRRNEVAQKNKLTSDQDAQRTLKQAEIERTRTEKRTHREAARIVPQIEEEGNVQNTVPGTSGQILN